MCHCVMSGFILFIYAYRNTIKAFYSAGILMDILDQFGKVSDEVYSKRKYAKWKAAYIHNCLKTGDTPAAGGPNEHLKNFVDLSKDPDEEPSYIMNNPMNPGITHKIMPKRPFTGSVSNPGDEESNTGEVIEPEPYSPQPDDSPVGPSVSPPVQPAATPSPAAPTPMAVDPAPAAGSTTVNPEDIQKAQKFCKFATSALNYDDIKAAVENLTKALELLQSNK